MTWLELFFNVHVCAATKLLSYFASIFLTSFLHFYFFVYEIFLKHTMVFIINLM